MNAKQISYLSTNYVLSAFIGYPSSMQKVIKFHSLQMIGRNYLFSLFEFLCVCQNKKEMQKITRTEFVYVCMKMFFMGYFFKVRAFGHYNQTSQSTISTTKSATSILPTNSSSAATTTTLQSSSLSSTTTVRTTHTSPRSKCFLKLFLVDFSKICQFLSSDLYELSKQ